jgi:two-component system CheB/CheR fusion protein
LAATAGRTLRAQIGAHIGKIHNVLKRRAGHDFSQYKESTIMRRLERRMKALQVDTIKQYFERLEREPEETGRLSTTCSSALPNSFATPQPSRRLGKR